MCTGVQFEGDLGEILALGADIGLGRSGSLSSKKTKQKKNLFWGGGGGFHLVSKP